MENNVMSNHKFCPGILLAKWIHNLNNLGNTKKVCNWITKYKVVVLLGFHCARAIIYSSLFNTPLSSWYTWKIKIDCST